MPAWLPYGTALEGLAKGPKHHLTDPALAARLMKVGASALLDGEGRVLTGTPASALGALFESLATLTVRVCDTSTAPTAPFEGVGRASGRRQNRRSGGLHPAPDRRPSSDW